MIGAVYKSFNISVQATQNTGDGRWVPDIRIFSAFDKFQPVDNGAFKTRHEAQEHGLKMAKSWIDRQLQAQLGHHEAADRFMATELYNGHVLKCRPSYDSNSTCWIPGISISWREGDTSNYHSFGGPPNLCGTEEHAILHGLALARAWVDKKL